ncbi:MAG: hypothetical protein HY277_02670 [Ignavibacteriales bacterium]|nr:hypothetical protein [Ignavibacteriales bacterium]
MLDPNPGLIIWTIITFLLLMVILKKFAWKPLLESLQRREESVRKKLKDEIIEKANRQTRAMLDQAKQEIDRDKEAALAQLRGEVANLAIQAASKILDETLDESRHRKIVDSYLKQLPKN